MNTSSDSTPNPGLPGSGNSPGSYPLVAVIVRQFLACNPFYLASAGVLLWGINQLSVAPKLAGAESAQILFNFTALFAYEILLVVTAIFLARRAIWDDALVLVGLENLFVLIPFSLVSRAVLINQPLAQEMCVAAAVLAFAKFWALKRFIPALNLSGPLLAIGGAALAFNVVLALQLQRLAFDRPSLHGWLMLAWLVALPLLAGLGVLLPKTRAAVTLLARRAWRPFAMFGLWLVVTGFHLFGVGYVHDFPWRRAFLAPTLLAVAWMVLLKTHSWDLKPSARWQRVLLCGPLMAPFLALADPSIFFALHLFNALAYGLFWFQRRDVKLPLALAALSLIVGTAGMPAAWLAKLALQRTEWVLAVGAVSTLIPILCSRDPRLGFLGAIGCSILVGQPILHADLSLMWAIQAGFVFVLVHSLRWEDQKHVGAQSARHLLGLLWVMASSSWIHNQDALASTGCLLAGGLVLAIYGLAGVISRRWPPPGVAVYAAATTCLSPSMDLMDKLREIPPGFVAILGSIPLLVAGTILALTRQRWQRGNSAARSNTTG